jgi:formylglycine-generating enzyme required for sulfatase activity
MSNLKIRARSLFASLRRLPLAAAVGVLCTPAFANAPCVSDLDGTGEVDAADIGSLLLQFGPCANGPNCSGDLDGDADVSAADIGMVLLSFGTCAGPGWATVLEWAPDPAVIYDSNLRSDIADTHLPWRVHDNGTGIEMVLIPPGTYTMGCSASNAYGCQSYESPTHQVTLTNAFYLSRTEVTQAQWVAKMGSNPSYFQSASSAVPASEVPNRPVEQVSWNDIQPFCTNNGLRLPTEAEWEYAYRAGTNTAFHGMPGYLNGTNDDNQLGTIAWFGGNSSGQTRPVAGKAANGFGLFDMSGNVWEWCQDWYGTYASGTQTNPTGPGSGSYRVLRGGSWLYGSLYCRASYRSYNSPYYRADRIGFRVARTP